jgi:hypothetical protein
MLHRFKATNPVWCVAFAFGLTIVLARWVSYVEPGFHYNIDGIHIHHYTYGIFMLIIAGYLALALKGPRATFWIALLYGWGAGFIFDEMGMWLNSSIGPAGRWNRTGVFVGTTALIASFLLAAFLDKQPVHDQTDSTVSVRKAGIELLAAPEEE